MITANIKTYSDAEVMSLVDRVVEGQIPYRLGDLKKLLAEVTNRRINALYVNKLTELINAELTGGSIAPGKMNPRALADKPREQTARGVFPEPNAGEQPNAAEGQREEEPFPVLNFLTGVLKVMAWIIFFAFIAAGVYAGVSQFIDEMIILAACVLAGTAFGVVFLLCFYAAAENIALKLEIEKHLRRIN